MMAVLTTYAKQRILVHYFAGYKAPTIYVMLQREGITTSRIAVWKFIHKYRQSGSLAKLEGGGRRSKITAEIKLLVDEQMLKDDETTAFQLHKLLRDRGVTISISTILRCRKELGWTFRGSAYCQLIRECNKVKRLEWATRYLEEAEDGFQDVIWTDESSVQMETHRRFCHRKQGSAPKSKPRYAVGP